MRFLILLLCVSTVLFSQSSHVSEKITNNKIIFEFKHTDLLNRFIAVPDLEHELTKQNNIELSYAFIRNSNRFYEIKSIKNNAILELTFKENLSGFKRKDESLSLNSGFILKQKLNRAKKNYPFTYLHDAKSIKIFTEKKGMHRLTFEYFITNNIQINDVEYLVERFRLINKGKEVPIYISSGNNRYIDKEGEFIAFYAERNLNTNFPESDDLYYDPYDKRNIYWLSLKDLSDTSPAKRLYAKNGQNIEPDQDKVFEPKYFNRTVHLEENDNFTINLLQNLESEYRNFGVQHNRDFSFWGSTIRTDEFKSFNISVLDDFYSQSVSSDNINFRVMMSGGASSYGGKHQIEFKISKSSTSFTNDNWYLSNKRKFEFQVAKNLLNTSNNTFEVKTISPNDYVLLNYIEIDFKSKFVARNNVLEFSTIAATEFNKNAYDYTIQGFTKPSIWLFKKNESLIVNAKITKINNNEYHLNFQDEIENRNSEFIALTDEEFQKPSSIKTNNILKENTVLKNYKSDAEMIIVSTEAFLAKANEYADFNKNNRNLNTEVINVELIYNEYNYGMESPVAIKNFISDAYSNWSDDNNLKYILFLGDSKRNPHQGNGLDYIIPSFRFISYRLGTMISDAYYGYLNFTNSNYFVNNPFSELHIGRIPAENVNELDAYLQKMKNYVSANAQIQNLFLSGNDFDTSNSANRELGVFERVFLSQQSRIHQNIVPETQLTLLKRAASDPISQTSTVLQETSQLINLFNVGLNYINFMGHGAGAQWGDRNIFTHGDAARLQNTNRYPIIASMTCFIGAFDDTRKTVGEELLIERNKGAVGLIGSSGVSLLNNQYMLSYYLNEFVAHDSYSFGEAIALGKYKYFKTGARYIADTQESATPEHAILKTLMLMEFNYIGDPSLKVKVPNKASILTDSEDLSNTQNLNFTISGFDNGTYNGNVTIYDYIGEPLFTKEYFGHTGTEITDLFEIDTLKSEQNVFFIKGYLRSATKIYNFGKKLKRAGSHKADISFVDPNTLEELELIAGRDYKIKMNVVFDYDQLTCSLIRNNFSSSQSSPANLTLSKIGSSYFSDQVFYVDKRDVSLDVLQIKGTVGSVTTSIRNQQFEIKSDKYYVAPIDNSIDISYSDKTKLTVGVYYPISYKDSLQVYVDYFRENVNFRDSLGRDTINFKTINSSIVSKFEVIENYNGQAFNYFVKVKTDSISKELAPEDSRLDKFLSTTPNSYIKDGFSFNDSISIQNNIQLVYNIQNADFNGSTPVSIAAGVFNKKAKESILDRQINITYHNSNFSFNNLNSNMIHFFVKKETADTLNPDLLIVEYFDQSIQSWIEILSEKTIDSNDNLIIAVANGMRKSGLYNIVQRNGIKPQVTISFEIEQNVADSIEFASISPQIKINLISNDIDYIVNPNNVILKIIDAQNDSIDVIPSFSYSGTNNSNLNLLIDKFTNLDKSGNYKVFAKLFGNVQLRSKNGVLSNNEATQLIEVSGENSLRYYGNYPNPFNSKTIITYQLTSSSYTDPSEVNLKIYTISGHLIKTIKSENAISLDDNFYSDNSIVNTNGTNHIGMNYIRWDGKDDDGNDVGNGVYFLKIIYKTSEKTIEKISKIIKFKGI
jgi:hypothetical protein